MSEQNSEQEIAEFASKLFDLARNGDITLVEYIKQGVSVDMVNQDGQSFVMLAAYNGHPELVKALVEVGADVNLLNDRNQSPLAGESGLHPYVAEKTAPIARRWSGDNISKAVIIVSDLDGQVKSLGRDGADYAVEAAVRQIAQLAR